MTPQRCLRTLSLTSYMPYEAVQYQLYKHLAFGATHSLSPQSPLVGYHV